MYPVLQVGPDVARVDVVTYCDRLAALIRAEPTDVVICDVSAVTQPTVAAVEVLARLRLTARRLGCELRISGAGRRLRDLAALTGLSAAVGLVGPGERQAEQREQPLDVQEVADGLDPAV